MCILSLIYRVVPDCPIFILTNRDESTERASLPPQQFDAPTGGSHWLGGADARAGGTWFGINEHGLIAAITNRAKTDNPPEPRSRGLLCRDVLSQPSAARAVDWVCQEVSRRSYAGFNLVIVATDGAWVIQAADELEATSLDAGFHCVGNSSLAIDEPRIVRMRSAIAEMVGAERSWNSFVARSKEICALHDEGGRPGLCIHRDHWGTVGSTICALPGDRGESEYHYAAGPPCRTLYHDYSGALRRLLKT